jgi:hypothetical protein
MVKPENVEEVRRLVKRRYELFRKELLLSEVCSEDEKKEIRQIVERLAELGPGD